MRKYGSLEPLQKQLMIQRSFGSIKRQVKTLDRKQRNESRPHLLYQTKKNPLDPKKPNFFSAHKYHKSPQTKKCLTIQSQSLFTTQIPPFNFEKIKKQCRAGSIVNQSRAVSRRLEKQMERDRKDKIGQLYRKKSTLLMKMKHIDSALKTKTQPLHQFIRPAKINSLIVRKDKKEKESRSYLSRNSRYLGDCLHPSFPFSFTKKLQSSNKKSPDSASSVQNNQKVLTFIKKVSQDTLKRDISRLSKFHQNLKSQLKEQFNALKKKDRKGHRASESTHFDSFK